MRGLNRWLVVLSAAILLLVPACTNDTLDDGDGPDVLLLVTSLENPPVTGQLDQATGSCTLRVEDWTATLRNSAKNSLAVTSPFNDIVMENVVISYDWISPLLSTPTRSIGLGDVAIPANSAAAVSFAPIAFDDLSLALLGRTANLTLTFNALTVEGTRISGRVERQLFVEACSN